MAIEALRSVSGYTTKWHPPSPTILRTCQAKGGATINKLRRVLVHVSVNEVRGDRLRVQQYLKADTQVQSRSLDALAE